MFRVPMTAADPTFDCTFKVSFWRWLTSSGAERIEWMRRRREARETAAANQRARADAFVQRKIAGVVVKAERGLADRVALGKTTAEEADETLARVRRAAGMT